MSDTEIIQLLGVAEIARTLRIKPPSVHDWIKGGIPEPRLVQLAGLAEEKSQGRFSRRERWPDRYAVFWPELAQAPTNSAQAATETVAQGA